VLTRSELLLLNCRPVPPGALSELEVRDQLAALPDWSLREGSIVRAYRFADYCETIAFVNALAWMVHREDHHPDLLVGYNGCEVRFSTHSVGGISENDFICAAKSDAIHAHQFGSGAA
jgi:4a-hydroxytetrahydrobiopterin dehydratase